MPRVAGAPRVGGPCPARRDATSPLTSGTASYQPSPGTVLFLGYGNESDGDPLPAQRFTWQPLRRVSDYFFVKLSYIYRR